MRVGKIRSSRPNVVLEEFNKCFNSVYSLLLMIFCVQPHILKRRVRSRSPTFYYLSFYRYVLTSRYTDFALVSQKRNKKIKSVLQLRKRHEKRVYLILLREKWRRLSRFELRRPLRKTYTESYVKIR